jgi:hypothetical protein
LSFDEDILALAFLGLATVLATFVKYWAIFQSPGYTVCQPVAKIDNDFSLPFSHGDFSRTPHRHTKTLQLVPIS